MAAPSVIMPLKQSPYRDEQDSHPIPEKGINDIYEAEDPADSFPERPVNSETIPELPDLSPVNWDDWLKPDLEMKNVEPDEGDVTSGPFMSQFNSLDHLQNGQQSFWDSPNLDYGTSVEYPFHVDDLMGSSSQTIEYQSDTTIVAFDTGFSQADELSMSPMTAMEMQTPSFQSENTGHGLSTLSGSLEVSNGISNMSSSAENLEGDKRTRKTRKDKGMKRRPRCTKDANVENNETIREDESSENVINKRKRSLTEDEDAQAESEGPQKHIRLYGHNLDDSMLHDTDDEWTDSTRPKWCRKDGHPNIKYRCKLHEEKEKKQGEDSNSGGFTKVSFTESVSRLFNLLATTIAPRKIYSRNKNQSQQAEASPSEPASIENGIQSTSSAEQGSHPTRTKTRKRIHNPRQPISVDMVRSAAPEGWDPYDNDFYSGDDNISDDGLEERGKALPYKPPRMACRRCNKLKQPCDHKYPSCSLCIKYKQRCRYRDDLTGRQIRPGQLEEVEAAYHHSQQQVKRLEKTIEDQKKALEAALGGAKEWEGTVRNMVAFK